MSTKEEYEGYQLKFGQANVGAFSYAVEDIVSSFDNEAKLYIGKFCSIAGGLQVILGGNHDTNRISTYPFGRLFPDTSQSISITKGDIIIGNDVWIGQNVQIVSGVKIGDGAVVGAFSVVTRDVPAYSLVAGNPAEIKKYRFPNNIISRLLRIAWWNWPIEKIQNSLPLLDSKNVEDFLEHYEKE